MSNVTRLIVGAILISIGLSLTAAPAFAQTAPQVPSQAQMKAAMQAYFNGRNARDTPKLKSLFSDDAMMEDPVGSPLQPAAALLDRVAGAQLKFNVHQLTATQTPAAAASLSIASANGTLNLIEIFTFKPDGKIASIRAFWGAEDRAK